MKNFIEKFKEKKLLKYQKDKEKYEKMSNDELELAYIDAKTNDRFFKIIGVIIIFMFSCAIGTFFLGIEMLGFAKLFYLIKDKTFEITNEFAYGSPTITILMILFVIFLISVFIYNGLMNVREILIIKKVRSEKITLLIQQTAIGKKVIEEKVLINKNMK